MIRAQLRKLHLWPASGLEFSLWPASGRRGREALRGIRADVSLPLDMFDAARSAEEAVAARKLEGLYHKGQARAWEGRAVLDELVARHGPPRLPAREREAIRRLFGVILWGELAAWKISAELAVRLEPLEAKLAATAQTHDESRHFYVMHAYLGLLDPEAGQPVLGPKTRRVLSGTLEATDLTRKLLGMQLMIEPLALALFQAFRERRIEPVLADLLPYYERDEARHVALGVLHLPKLLRGMSPLEAVGLWRWMFREYWAQFEMLREIEPFLRVVGVDPRAMAEIGRDKQVKAFRMLCDELGYELPVLEGFVRFFDALVAWELPDDRAFEARLDGVLSALGKGSRAPVPDLAVG